MEIDGREIAKEILNELKLKVQKLKVKPQLAIILIGKNPQSVSYVEQKEIKGVKIGVKVVVKNLELGIKNKELLKIIEDLNNDRNIHGIIVQRPVPNISSDKLDLAVSPEKDVDGFNPASKFEPPIALAVKKILEIIFKQSSSTAEVGSSSEDRNLFHSWLASKLTVIIGKGQTGGGPIRKMFNKEHIYPEILDSKTKHQEMFTLNADIIISAVGKLNIVSSKDIEKGSILISVGLHKGNDDKLHGDYDEDDIKDKVSFYTPTPGGVGPVNVAMLLKNLVKAAGPI